MASCSASMVDSDMHAHTVRVMTLRATKLVYQPPYNPSPPHPLILAVYARRPPRFALHPPPQVMVPLLGLDSPDHPPRHSPSHGSRQQLASIRQADDPAGQRRDGRPGQLRECELQRNDVRDRLGSETQARRRGGVAGEGVGDAVFVDVGDGGVVLRQQGEEDGGGARGEVVDAAETERTGDEGEEEWREEGSVEKGGEEERLGSTRQSVRLVAVLSSVCCPLVRLTVLSI